MDLLAEHPPYHYATKLLIKISSNILLLDVQCFFSCEHLAFTSIHDWHRHAANGCPASLNFARVVLIAMIRWAAVIMMGLLCVAYSLTTGKQLSNHLYFGPKTHVPKHPKSDMEGIDPCDYS